MSPTFRGLDGFVYDPTGPGGEAYSLIDRYLEEAGSNNPQKPAPLHCKVGKEILARSLSERLIILRAAILRIKRLSKIEMEEDIVFSHEPEEGELASTAQRCREALEPLVEMGFTRLPADMEPDDIVAYIDALIERATRLEPSPYDLGSPDAWIDFAYLPPAGAVPALLEQAEKRKSPGPLPPNLVEALTRLRDLLHGVRYWAGFGKSLGRVDALLGIVLPGMPDTDEAWGERMWTDIEQMSESHRLAWLALLSHPSGSNAPGEKWRRETKKLLGAVGEGEFHRYAPDWLSLVGQKATAALTDHNSDILRTLLFTCALAPEGALCRAIGSAAEAFVRKLPAGGLYSSRTFKAALYALSVPDAGTEGVAQLARLKQRVKSPWGQEQVNAAFEEAARRMCLPPAELEELAMPDFGLDGNGCVRFGVEEEGKCAFEMTVDGSRKAVLRWMDENGVAVEKVPAAVQKSHVLLFKEARRTASEIEKFLSAQRERLDLMMRSEREWEVEAWRERYLDHPLLRYIARRLIWNFSNGNGEWITGIWQDGKLVDASSRPLEGLHNEATRVRLWHPIGAAVEEVIALRDFLYAHDITQPFKQAYREVYLLTDAERRTSTYSNRFAAHILRQHAFHALCQQRGWQYDYLGSWDSGNYQATLELPQWDLHAEFWVDGVAGGALAESGVALYIATDQVRFCRARQSDPLPLPEIPPLIFSEVMRDVDLFVGVTSIGNDPTRDDAGEDGAHRGYWNAYSFGELSASARMRGEALERLLPRLKIADRCRVEGRFLRVQGDLRSYKIHLGSGNILMEPNDQYLCIVPDRAGRKGDSVFLPFEGDSLLSVILSKAFLLAEDTKIIDPTIKVQIAGR